MQIGAYFPSVAELDPNNPDDINAKLGTRIS